MDKVFIQLGDGTLLNPSAVIRAYAAHGMYWVDSALKSFSISREDFRKLRDYAV